MMKVLAKLIPPAGDKHWSFQAVRLSPEQRLSILAAVTNEQVQVCRPFRQGDSGNWLMIEFWTAVLDDIQVAARVLADSIEVELGHGEFTREEALGR